MKKILEFFLDYNSTFRTGDLLLDDIYSNIISIRFFYY